MSYNDTINIDNRELEFCTVTIAPAIDFDAEGLYYQDGSKEDIIKNKLHVLNMYKSTDIEVVKNTILCIECAPTIVDVQCLGDAILLNGGSVTKPFLTIAIMGDCHIFSIPIGTGKPIYNF